mmetsp:Transcript_27711/g.31962  ORF Transcript_27711/g.31962 Transcript_27711/m.31962 type:complete len:212 (+) Transcript_27711:244-879(+)
MSVSQYKEKEKFTWEDTSCLTWMMKMNWMKKSWKNLEPRLACTMMTMKMKKMRILKKKLNQPPRKAFKTEQSIHKPKRVNLLNHNRFRRLNLQSNNHNNHQNKLLKLTSHQSKSLLNHNKSKRQLNHQNNNHNNLQNNKLSQQRKLVPSLLKTRMMMKMETISTSMRTTKISMKEIWMMTMTMMQVILAILMMMTRMQDLKRRSKDQEELL